MALTHRTLAAGAAIAALFAAAGFAVAAPATTAPSYEEQVRQLTNQERVAGGCPALAWNDKLAAAAKGHNDEMAKTDTLSHTGKDGSNPSQRIDRAGYDWQTIGENVAFGQKTPAEVVKAWMNSPVHKANIMNCAYLDLGVAYAPDKKNRLYWTQNFGTLHGVQAGTAKPTTTTAKPTTTTKPATAATKPAATTKPATGASVKPTAPRDDLGADPEPE
ncbi:CAP domain-containing protein [Actinosynnema sp.]|uniref:CAP domain-containing protein n=1 Tax=Actinosynnema sp. TaxID=1872144 RepID=UPI003F873323